MAINPPGSSMLPPVPGGPGPLDLSGLGGGPTPDTSGLAQLLGQVPQRPEEALLMKLRPALRMVQQLVDYVSISPEIGPMVKVFLNAVLGTKQKPGGMPGTSAMTPSPGLTPPAMPTPPTPMAPKLPGIPGLGV
jgi:hypothetical protein